MIPLAHLLLAASLVSHAAALTWTELDAELKKPWPTNRTLNLVFHGHQIPAGYQNPPQVSPFDSYPHLFRLALKSRYPNAVINTIVTATHGETSNLGAARFAADVLSQSPDLIVLDYTLTDVGISLAAMESAWRAMIDAAQAASVPVIALTPLGTPTDDLTLASTAMRQRADLLRTIAAGEGVPLADASLKWLERAAAESASSLLSPAGLPDRHGHQVITDSLLAAFTAETGLSITLPATAFPRGQGQPSFTTPDTRITFTTTHSFSGSDNFLGDSGGTSNRVNAWDGAETLALNLAVDTQLSGFRLRWTNATITISGLSANPQATISGTTNTATWNATAGTLTLPIPWDNGAGRTVTFANPSATQGANLIFSFSGAANYQAAFTGFDCKTFGGSLPDLLVHYGFETSGISGTALKDYSGNSNNGSIVTSASAPVTSEPGLPGQSFRFTAGDDPAGIVNIASGIVPSGNAPRTIALRFQHASDAGQNKLFGYGTNAAGRALDFGIEGGGLRIRHFGGSITYGSNLDFLGATAGWHHVTLRVNPGATTFANVDVFLDGTKLTPQGGGATSVALNTAVSPLAIGSSATPTAAVGFDGWIDDFRVYGKALTDGEIATLAIAPQIPRILEFTANPQNRVPAGTNVTLNWSTENAETLTLDPGSINVTGLTTYQVTPTAKTNYTLTATDATGGSDSKSVTLSAGETPFPNVIVFFLDDFAWSDWQQNGAPTGSVFHETPYMNRLAAEGRYYPNGYASSPVCSPTRGALMTGQAPAFNKLTDWITGSGDAGKPIREADWIKKLPTTTPNFASILRGSGYRTIHVGKWHLGESGTPEANPLNFGFDVNIGGNDVGTPPAPERFFASANGFSALPNLGPAIAPTGSYLTDVLTQQAVAQIRAAAAGDTAFAMYFAHYAVHTPIQAPAATVAKYQAKLNNNPGMNWQGQTNPTYAAMVDHADLSLGAILAALENPDGNPVTNDSIANNTLVIFTADNGGFQDATSNRPLRDGKGGNYEGGIREPWVFWWPGKITPGIVQEPIVTHDLLPTVLDLAEIPAPAGHLMTGQNISPTLFGLPFERTRPLTFHYPHWSPQGGSPYSAIRRGNWKLIYLYPTSSWELYNLATDIGETNNLINTETNLHAVLSWFLVDDLEKLGATYPRSVATLAELQPAPLVRDDVDSDGDGRSNFREAIEGTNPNNAQSRFQPAPVLNGAQFQIPIDGLRHRRYRIWESTDLTPNSWQNATTLGPLVNNGSLLYQKPATEPRRFFRIETLFP